MGTITGAAIRALGGKAISQLVDTRAAARAGAAALADLLESPRAIIDDGFEVSIRGRVTETDQHGLKLIMLFKPSFVKARSASVQNNLSTLN